MKKSKKQIKKIVNESKNLYEALCSLTNEKYCVDDIYSYTELEETAVAEVQEGNLILGEHILTGIEDYDESFLFDYDYSMGVEDNVFPINSKEELIEIICDKNNIKKVK